MIFVVNPPQKSGIIRPTTGPVIAGNTTEPCWVLLGAFGDICAMLPYFREESRMRGHPVKVIVAKTYAPMFEGVSYVKPVVFNGDYSRVNEAMQLVSQTGGKPNLINPPPMVVQAYGNPKFQRLMDSFVKEMWRFAGRQEDWDKFPLVFDKRDYAREKQLAGDHIKNENRLFLVAGSGRSSPFNHKDELIALLVREFPEFQVLDLSEVKAEKPYDLLGLFDRAQMLFTPDTMALHLSRASSVPVFAFYTTTPTPWHGSPAYLNQIGRMPYTEFPERGAWLVKFIKSRMASEIRTPKLLHVYSEYDRRGDALRRHMIAKASWHREYEFGSWKSCPIRDRDLSRNSASVGDKDKTVPFLKDVIELAVKRHHPQEDDVIVFTNDDTCFSPGLAQSIVRAVRIGGAVHAHRRDFYAMLSRSLETHEVRRGQWYPGTDLIAFTRSWWRNHRDELPDFLLSYEAWDRVFRELVKLHDGTEIHESIYHEWHSSFWAANRIQNVGNIYNRKLAREWLTKHGHQLAELDFVEGNVQTE